MDERPAFSIPEPGPPIVAPPARKGEMTEARSQKKALAEAGYPPRETAALAEKLYDHGQGVFQTLPERAILFVTPSTTRQNTLPAALARRIQVDRPDLLLANEEDLVARAMHREQSEMALRPSRRRPPPVFARGPPAARRVAP